MSDSKAIVRGDVVHYRDNSGQCAPASVLELWGFPPSVTAALSFAMRSTDDSARAILHVENVVPIEDEDTGKFYTCHHPDTCRERLAAEAQQ